MRETVLKTSAFQRQRVLKYDSYITNKCLLLTSYDYVDLEALEFCISNMIQWVLYTLRNKGTKAVTGAVPFQKVHACT